MAYDIFYRDTFGKQNSYHKSNVTGKKVSQVISDYAKLQTPWNFAFFHTGSTIKQCRRH